MQINTIQWVDGKVVIIDQTRLPLEEIYLDITDFRILAAGIKSLKVRGAPAIGIAGAFGVCLGANEIQTDDVAEFKTRVKAIIDELAATRPTAVNLFWALEKMRAKVNFPDDASVPRIRQRLLDQALLIEDEDRRTCRRMGEHGAMLLKDGDTVLTHCNAGALATSDFGTALGVIYSAQAAGKTIKVYADETRPLLQGARLTSWELMKSGIDVTLICDDMAASVMQRGLIGAVIVGADRIAQNGDTANKIGTLNLAVLAHYFGIPFYVVAPTSTIDSSLGSGKEIPIELRSPDEVTQGFGRRTAPEGVSVFNPAFDVTPHELITAIVTENGVSYPPYKF
ncbi:MAG: S-methyl-5-thioribose-1-phosphate isomerase [Candidatus Zhuqueibacterota bacterium]